MRRSLQHLWKGLDEVIPNIRELIPKPTVLADALPKGPCYKGYEDAVDALVCAWVAVEFVNGRCKGYGDEESCIWIPKR